MNSQSDLLHRFLFESLPIRGELVQLEKSWHAVLEKHDYPPALRDIMGELLAAAALLAATLKLQGSLILQIQGKGPVRLLVVECTGDMKMRATAKWDGDPHGGLAEMVGDGHFVITLDPKEGREAYQGIVALEGNSVAEILQNYMWRSEQLETRLWLAADEKHASGMLLQKLPEDKEKLHEQHDPDAWPRVIQLADTLKPEELMTLPVQTLLHRLYHEEDIRLFDAQPVVFYCACSREKVASMLKMLGQGEIDSILQERGSIEIHCEFCNQRYEFDKVDAAQLFSAGYMTEVSDTRH